MLPEPDMLATVVVCEDDDQTRELLCDNLTADRYDVLEAPTASDALRFCHFRQPDVMLLDLGLPDASGLDVLREIRRSDGATSRYDPRMPVIVLSGAGADQARVRGIRAGADDYLVKPVFYDELTARLTGILGRRSSARSGPVRVGELVVDPSRREARVAGEPVALATKEFDLLRALAADPQRVFSKEELLRDVWGFQTMGRTRTLDSHASRLRRKLDPEHGRFVRNCWGVGYRLVDG